MHIFGMLSFLAFIWYTTHVYNNILIEKIKFDRVRRDFENMVKMSQLNGYNSSAGDQYKKG